MLISTVNVVFALIFGAFARNALPRGARFCRFGWLLLTEHASKPDARTHVEHRRAISEGGMFVLSGLFWLGGGLIAGGLTLLFASRALGL